MSNKVFCKVVDGVIVEYNRVLPFSTQNVSFGVETSDEVMAEYGYLPVVGEAPALDEYTRQAGVGYVVKDGFVEKVYNVESVSIEELKEIKLSELASYRFEKETGGIEVNGAVIKTDRDSQATLTGAYVAVQQNPNLLIDWKSETGWIQIDKATVEALCMAVTAHVQGCFTKERQIAESIGELESVTDVVNFDIAEAWDAV